MRNLTRALAALTTSAVLVGGAFALPAGASPENGEGCAGLPSVPATYVCVISVTPAGVVPSTTTTPIPVAVPAVCYVAGCTAPTTVAVPVPGVTAGSGTVAVLWYQGVSYPIGLGIGGTVMPIVNDAIVYAAGVAGGYVDLIQNTVNDLPDAGELADAVVTLVLAKVQPYINTVIRTIQNLPTTEELAEAFWNEVNDTLARVQPYVDTVQRYLDIVHRYVDSAPERVAELRESLYDTLQDLKYVEIACTVNPSCWPDET